MTQAPETPSVWVVIVNFNSYGDTAECLESLAVSTYSGMTVVLVDNGSSDGSGQELEKKYSQVKHIRSEENKGFAGGANLGIRSALDSGAKFICLLNNDTLVEPGFIEPLVERAGATPDAGIIGGKILYADNPDIIWFAGGSIDRRRGFTSHRGQDLADSATFNKPGYVDYVTGCLFFVRASLFSQLGLLREDFFMYAEEVDFCLRARRAGFRCFFEPGSVIMHKVSRSMEGAYRPVYYYYLSRNLLEIYSGHMGMRRLSIGVFRLAWHLVFVQSLTMLRAHRTASAPYIAALWSGLFDFIRARMGRCGRSWLETAGGRR
ncbi:MAG: glycosyltransferase family 2 protein [Thermoleophilia bacterium]